MRRRYSWICGSQKGENVPPSNRSECRLSSWNLLPTTRFSFHPRRVRCCSHCRRATQNARFTQESSSTFHHCILFIRLNFKGGSDLFFWFITDLNSRQLSLRILIKSHYKARRRRRNGNAKNRLSVFNPERFHNLARLAPTD